MRKHFTKSLAVIFAVLGVYFVAFKVLMKVGFSMSPLPPRSIICFAKHESRWGSEDMRERRLETEKMRTFFAPLIWLDRKINRKDALSFQIDTPEPNWVKEWKAQRAEQ